jgi:YVTN family beta-propeller protein
MRNVLLALALLLTSIAQADTLLVLNKSDSTLSFVDPVTLKVMASIPTGDTPHEVEVSKDGRIAVVANYGTGPNPGSTLSIVDVKARKELKRLTLPLLRPHGLFAIGNHIYVTTEGSRVVARYDVAKGEIDWIAGTGAEVSHMVVVGAGETKIYTANIGSDSISVLDLTEAPRRIGLKQIAVGKGPEGLDLTPDGKQLWTSHRADPNLSVIDTATDKVVKVMPTGTKMANRLKFTPDGKRVLISDTGSNELVILDAATGEVVKRVATLAQPAGILIAPGGQRAFIACLGAKTVQVVDLAKLEVVDSIPAGNAPDGMAWAP